MTFLVMPAVDLKGGKVVRLVQGDPRFKTVELDDPVSVAAGWEELGAKRLHLVDLDGALGGVRKNEMIVKEIVESLSIPVEFGGGIRSFEDAGGLLDFGVEKIILGTAAIKDRELLERLKEKYGPDRLIVALDSKEGRVVTKGWVEDTGQSALSVVKEFEGFVSEVLFTNVDVEGLVKGIDTKPIEELVKETDIGIIASGGVFEPRDVELIKEAGAVGVVIGTALYKGAIDYRDIICYQEV